MDEVKKKTWGQREYRKGKETITVQHANVEPARTLAKSLGYTITRGFGAGEGNIDGVLGVLASAYERDPDGVLAVFKEWRQAGEDAP